MGRFFTGTLQIGTSGAFSTFHCDPGHFGKAKFTEPLYRQPLYESCPLHESHFESRCCCFRYMYECAPVCPVCVPCVSRLPPVSFYRTLRSDSYEIAGPSRDAADCDSFADVRLYVCISGGPPPFLGIFVARSHLDANFERRLALHIHPRWRSRA